MSNEIMIKKKTTLNKQKLENEPEIINSNQTDKDQKKKNPPQVPSLPIHRSTYFSPISSSLL